MEKSTDEGCAEPMSVDRDGDSTEEVAKGGSWKVGTSRAKIDCKGKDDGKGKEKVDQQREGAEKNDLNLVEVERDDEEATVQGSKEGTEELLRKIVYSEEEAYKLYCDYGHCMGFSIRKGKQSYFTGTKRIRTKDYFCSKEGLKEGEKLTEANFNDPHTRTNCKAMVRFRANEQGEWKVIRLVSDHNHKLAKPEERHLLRSARSLISGRSTEALLFAGYQPPPDAYSNIAGGDGGNNDVGTGKLELSTYVSIQKMPGIDGGDLQVLVNHLKSRATEDGTFFWDVQVDQSGRATNFFWRDGRSRFDYDCFGDVVVFDSTFRINKYNLICAPFMGVNHHWQNTMYGCAFLTDETASSFVWLFKSFLGSTGNRPPISIFTNQDQAMVKAIEEVLPNTRHRIAQWHIQKDAMSRLGALTASRSFYKMFTKCMQGCDSETEFEETWSSMLCEFDLQDNKWLQKLYKLRKKWCSALNKDTFDGGIEFEPQCDSMSNVFNGIFDKSTSLETVVLAVSKLIDDWREKEYEEDFRSNQKPPVCVIKHSDILNHAAKVYTHRVYKLFETDYLDGCGATKFNETSCSETSYTFEMTMQGRGSNVCEVLLDTSTMELSCSCNKFQTMGLLCPHTLKALSVKNVGQIPERYILKRWTKDAKKWVYNLKQFKSLELDCYMNEVVFCSHVMRYAYELVLKSQGQEDSRKIFWDTLENGEKELEKFFESSTNYGPPYTTR